MFTHHRYSEIEDLHRRVRELEEKVQHLRLSRRILMNILETLEREKKRQAETLGRINQRLRKGNHSYARKLMEKNWHIITLQEEINRWGKKGG